MGNSEKLPRRNGEKDLAELIRILGDMPSTDFNSLQDIFDNYQRKSSTLRTVRLFADALSISKIRRLKEFSEKPMAVPTTPSITSGNI